ncbi:hypothetical protein FH972_021895 [Carpinus fangiana]|uniref:Uncharacterized protein n=1 Tax=Carpinus fangiana TaxID=176857 RepID=A0A5N6KQN7_9ROSI|nr:hypothetical protein FH972_021895 [Carpinus fangiana]
MTLSSIITRGSVVDSSVYVRSITLWPACPALERPQASATTADVKGGHLRQMSSTGRSCLICHQSFAIQMEPVPNAAACGLAYTWQTQGPIATSQTTAIWCLVPHILEPSDNRPAT